MDASTHTCPHCAKDFSHASSLSRHKKSCLNKNKPIVDHKSSTQELMNHIVKLNEQIQDLMEKQMEMSRRNESQGHMYNAIYLHECIHLKAHGKETFDHIPHTQMVSCARLIPGGFLKMFKLLYFNDEVAPYNHNILNRSANKQTAWFFNGNDWETISYSELFARLARKIYSMLNVAINNEKIRLLGLDDETCDQLDDAQQQWQQVLISGKTHLYSYLRNHCMHIMQEESKKLRYKYHILNPDYENFVIKKIVAKIFDNVISAAGS